MPTPDQNIRPTEPKVTVIIPNHNYGQWVTKAINSAIAQDYESKRIVIVDDGSTDGSKEIILEHLRSVLGNIIRQGENVRDELVYWCHESLPVFFVDSKNAYGPAMARNIGIQILFGDTDYFGMLDSDDYWLPGKISKSVAKFQQFPSCGLVYTDNINFFEDGNTIREYREPFGYGRLLKHNMIHSGSFVSKKAFETVGGYEPSLRVAEDLDLWIRIAEAYGVIHIPEALVMSRVHTANANKSVDMAVWQQCWKKIAERVQSRNAPK